MIKPNQQVLKLIKAIEEMAATINPSVPFEQRAKKVAEILTKFLNANSITIYLHSHVQDIYTVWPESFENKERKDHIYNFWLGKEKTYKGEVGTVLKRGRNKIGAILGSFDTNAPNEPDFNDIRKVIAFHSIAHRISLIFENGLLLQMRGRFPDQKGWDPFSRDMDRRGLRFYGKQRRPYPYRDFFDDTNAELELPPPLPEMDEDSSSSIPESPIFAETVSSGFFEGDSILWESNLDIDMEGDKELKVEDLEEAYKATKSQLIQIKQEASEKLDNAVAAIFDAHLLMLSDAQFYGRIKEKSEKGKPIIEAIRDVVQELESVFQSLEDKGIREKAQDIKDLGARLIRNLRGDSTVSELRYSDKVILAEEMFPSELVALAAQNVGAIILIDSGMTSHLSILARSLEIPTMLTLDSSLLKIPDKTRLALDPYNSQILFNPQPEHIQQLRIYEKQRKQEIDDVSVLSAVHLRLEQHLLDVIPAIRANVNLYHDAQRAKTLCAEGIGLYRSEFPYIIRSDYLGEEDQYAIYSRIADTFPEAPLYFRTADIGGDKELSWNKQNEANPFLGVRGIRFSLSNPEMFQDQLRAMLRAGYERDLRIMFPMVSGVEEIHSAKEHIKKAIDCLVQEGYDCNRNPKLGAMIELPSAVIIAERLAEELDFFSIGTNDLVMYLLGADRTNGNLIDLYCIHHPAVLITLDSLIKRLSTYDVEISVCGDSASDPAMLPFYLALKISSISVSPDNLIKVRKYIAALDQAKVEEIHDRMLAIRDSAEMNAYVKSVAQEIEERVHELFE
ncbi:phosphoenolpyruvate--protein phosphotransferase [Spirochaeta cellobiosiphila]|uniref:phosphoenolpyruvate--protein phosphotransferase n=1 Tax=Spirochaeta cellobiosiphila TaxID=504483 RepID=UPI00040C3576|nr:phosphoenolpyruvate--protein phosphotransferase [Spirochaeta cellobiosiphila]